MTVEQVKAYLNLKGTAHDAYIGAVLPLFEEMAYQRLQLLSATPFPAQAQLVIAKAVQIYAVKAGVMSQSQGDVSINYDQVDAFDYLGQQLDLVLDGGSKRFGFVPMSGKVTPYV